MQLRPMDIVIVDGEKNNPIHWMIQWRSLDSGVHCFTVKDTDGNGYNPRFAGVKTNHISMYNGRKVTVCRYNKPMNVDKLLAWCEDKCKNTPKYDFWSQWILGFVLGISTKEANNEQAWTCSELPYWAFQENECPLTGKEELLPLPRLFKYHKDFDVVFSGVLR